MCAKLPSILEPLLNKYTAMLTDNFNSKIHGIYIYNSVATGAFIANKSDIDIIVILNSEFSKSDFAILKDIHSTLKKEFSYAKYMEGMYLPINAIGKCNNELKPYLFFCNGILKSYGYYDINAVTWYTFKNYGIALSGPSTSYIDLTITDSDLMKTMNYNLNKYWKNKSYKKFIFLLDSWIEFSVVTICRILYTLDTRCITSKNNAIEYVLLKHPDFSPNLLKEALRIRLNSSKNSLYSNRIARAKAARDFIKLTINYCNSTYEELQIL